MLRKTFTTLAILLALAIPSSAAAANTLGQGMFGISPGGAIQNQDATTLGRDLDTLQSAGSKWLRIDINWAQIQAGGPTSYNWGPIDRVVQGATSRGMNVLGVIVYTPNWARPSGTSATYGPDPATYAAFARKAAEHYSAMGVDAYEIWNEPNTPAFWTPAPNRADYTRLLKVAYPAIKAADPSATVLTGGTAPAPSDGTSFAPVDFLRGIYSNGGRGFFDAVSHHPYCWPAAPGDAEAWSAWYQMYGTNPSLRSTMIDNGDGAKKIWGTEFGAPTNGPSGSHVSESTQANMITKAYNVWKGYDWSGPLFTYSGRDLGTSTTTRENFFGLVRNDFSPKPSFAAYKAAATGTTTTEPPATEPSPDSGTTTTVRGRGRGKVKGQVSTTSSPRATSAPRLAGARVKLRLMRKSGGWRSASQARKVTLRSGGRFKTSLRSLKRQIRPGVYRVKARYLGTDDTKPSASRSNRFRVR